MSSDSQNSCAADALAACYEPKIRKADCDDAWPAVHEEQAQLMLTMLWRHVMGQKANRADADDAWPAVHASGTCSLGTADEPSSSATAVLAFWQLQAAYAFQGPPVRSEC